MQPVAAAGSPQVGSVRETPWRAAARRWSGVLLAAVVLAMALAQLSPVAPAALEYRRDAVETGEPWRLVTGHLVHHGWRHLAVDVAAFAALWWVAGRRGARPALVAALSAVAVGLGIHLWPDAAGSYRGVSAIGYALLAAVLVKSAMAEGGWKRAAWLAVLAAVAVKAAAETATGKLLVNPCLPEGVVVVGIAHVVGIATGAAAAILPVGRKPAPRRQGPPERSGGVSGA